MTENKAAVTLKPLKIKCTSTDCGNGLHCFRKTKKLVMANQIGRCRSCGVELVDWARVHQRNISDAAYTFQMLRHEMIRHHFWHIEIDDKAVRHARRKGRIRLHEATEKRIRQSVSAAQPVYDGRQTPMQGNSIYYAQHATAACCRKCIEEWHGIPQGRELSEAEIKYLTDLCVRYLNERLSFVTEHGEDLPRGLQSEHEGNHE
jgi:hypothetical protein